jgi:hypothetical protein
MASLDSISLLALMYSTSHTLWSWQAGYRGSVREGESYARLLKNFRVLMTDHLVHLGVISDLSETRLLQREISAARDLAGGP